MALSSEVTTSEIENTGPRSSSVIETIDSGSLINAFDEFDRFTEILSLFSSIKSPITGIAITPEVLPASIVMVPPT